MPRLGSGPVAATLALLGALAPLAACSAANPADRPTGSRTDESDPDFPDWEAPPDEDFPATHGMAIFGQNQLYFYHLPLFHPPHKWQALFVGGIAASDGRPFVPPPGVFHTVVPEEFRLVGDLKATLDQRQPFAFLATIVQGHFEPGHFEPQGRPISAGPVPAHVDRAIMFNRLPAPRPADLGFLLFGKGAETYLVHLLDEPAESPDEPPQFDQILHVQVPPGALSDESLAMGVTVIAPGAPYQPVQVNPDSAVDVVTTDPGQTHLALRILDLVYFETNDLAH
jgi:hypothetical protein